MTTNQSNIYRTDDMALVTWLRMNHFSPVEVIWENNTCNWDFEREPKLLSDVDAFVQNMALCNPREFSRQFKITRQEFHAARPASQRR